MDKQARRCESWIAGAVAAAAVASACSSQHRVRAETAVAQALISDQEEERLGEQVHRELAKQGTRYLDDPIVVAYVTDTAARILPFARKDRPNVRWHVHVVDDPKMVNAFATPGGHLYIASGLILATDSQAELAGVLAHEAGHVVGRHSARQIVTAMGLQAATALALGDDPGLLAGLAASIAGQGALLAHSRSDEHEADQYGTRYASAAGFDPHGIVTFFSKLKARQGGGNTPAVLGWLSTHPAPEDRIARVNDYIREHRLGGSYLGRERLPAIKQRVLAAAQRRRM